MKKSSLLENLVRKGARFGTAALLAASVYATPLSAQDIPVEKDKKAVEESKESKNSTQDKEKSPVKDAKDRFIQELVYKGLKELSSGKDDHGLEEFYQAHKLDADNKELFDFLRSAYDKEKDNISKEKREEISSLLKDRDKTIDTFVDKEGYIVKREVIEDGIVIETRTIKKDLEENEANIGYINMSPDRERARKYPSKFASAIEIYDKGGKLVHSYDFRPIRIKKLELEPGKYEAFIEYNLKTSAMGSTRLRNKEPIHLRVLPGETSNLFYRIVLDNSSYEKDGSVRLDFWRKVDGYSAVSQSVDLERKEK